MPRHIRRWEGVKKPWVYLLTLSIVTTAFNIDTEYPIVLSDHFDGSRSLFGASVILLEGSRTLEGGTDSEREGWILIGTPKANSTFPNHKDILEPGVVWRCSIRGNDNECRQIVMDPTDANYDPKVREFAHQDLKSEGWLGGSMTMGKDRFVACASRWINRKYSQNIKLASGSTVREQSHYMLGICYWVPKAHLQARQLNSTWPWLPPNHSYRLLPLASTSRAYSVNDWKYGQAGFSAFMTADDVLILGAPGVKDWTGSVIEYSDSAQPQPGYSRFNSEGRNSFAQVLVSQSMQTEQGNFFEYFGYAVTSGKYFRGHDTPQYAVGAPRASNNRGKIYVFTLRKRSEANSTNRDAAFDVIYEGGGSGPDKGGGEEKDDDFYFSYFGSVLCTSDVDGNGFDDLLVGAPDYTLTDGDEDIPGNEAANLLDETKWLGEQGCVFVFLSNGDNFNGVPQRLCGEGWRGSKFGYAIMALGDLQGDNYPDVAVGAPYENKLRGAVYIYRGSPSGLKFSQKINPGSVQDGIRGFGFSLSPGTDVDGNSYPDLAVGCPFSNQVVIYRTIPVVTATGIISGDVEELWANTLYFHLRSCIVFHGKSLPPILNFTVNVTLDTNYTSRGLQLLEWDIEQLNATATAAGAHLWNWTSMALGFTAAFHNGSCYSFPVVKVNDPADGTIPITFFQEFQLQRESSQDGLKPEVKPIYHTIDKAGEDDVPSIRSPETNPAFNAFYDKIPLSMAQNSAFKAHGILPLSKMCLSLNTNSSHECVATLILHAFILDSQGVNYSSNGTSPYTVKDTNVLTLHLWAANVAEFAHPPVFVRLFWAHNNLQAMGADSPGKNVACDFAPVPEEPDRKGFCGVSKAIRHGETDLFHVDLKLDNLYYGNGPSWLVLRASASSEQFPDTFFHYRFPLEYRSSLLIKEIGKQTWTSTKDLFSQEFLVELDGPSPVAGIEIQMIVPEKVLIDGVPESLWEIATSGSMEKRSIACARKEIFTPALSPPESWGKFPGSDPDKGEMVTSWGNSTREFQNQALFPWMSPGKSRGGVRISCHSPSVICGVYKCEKLPNVLTSHTASFGIRFTLSLEERHFRFFRGLDKLHVVTEVLGKILVEDPSAEEQVRKEMGTYLTLPKAAETSALAVIIGLISGLILLALMIFILSKCGFFRRRRRESMEDRLIRGLLQRSQSQPHT